MSEELDAIVHQLVGQIDRYEANMKRAVEVAARGMAQAEAGVPHHAQLAALANPTDGRFSDQVRRCVQLWCAFGLTTENAALLIVAAAQSAMQRALGDGAEAQTAAALRRLAAHLEKAEASNGD